MNRWLAVLVALSMIFVGFSGAMAEGGARLPADELDRAVAPGIGEYHEDDGPVS